MKTRSVLSILSILILLGCGSTREKADELPNVLFISIDDLNDWERAMGGNPQAITPNLEQAF